MTVLFRLAHYSPQDSITISFTNLKEKLTPCDNKIMEEK